MFFVVFLTAKHAGSRDQAGACSDALSPQKVVAGRHTRP